MPCADVRGVGVLMSTAAVEQGWPRPGELTDRDRVRLVNAVSDARRFRDWAAVAELLHGHRAAGAPVEELAVVVGVTGNRVRAICREHPAEPDGDGVGADLLAASGWVLTAAAAELLGVSLTRLDRHAAAGHRGRCHGVRGMVPPLAHRGAARVVGKAGRCPVHPS